MADEIGRLGGLLLRRSVGLATSREGRSLRQSQRRTSNWIGRHQPTWTRAVMTFSFLFPRPPLFIQLFSLCPPHSSIFFFLFYENEFILVFVPRARGAGGMAFVLEIIMAARDNAHWGRRGRESLRGPCRVVYLCVYWSRGIGRAAVIGCRSGRSIHCGLCARPAVARRDWQRPLANVNSMPNAPNIRHYRSDINDFD